MDGTLIDYYGTYSDKVPPLIKELQEKNILVAVATGKAFFGEVARIIEELDLSPLNIVNGGGMIINWKNGETPWHQPISERSTKQIVEYFNKTNLVFSLETKESAYMLKVVETPAYTKEIIVKEYTVNSIPSQVLKILVHASANKMTEIEIENHIKKIKEDCKDVAVMKFSFGDYFGLDTTSEMSTKHTAVLEYAKILGISPNEIVAVGDGHNDYPLFTACGYRIAMGNAPRELREIADKIVAPSAEGGMEEALEHIISLCGELPLL